MAWSNGMSKGHHSLCVCDREKSRRGRRRRRSRSRRKMGRRRRKEAIYLYMHVGRTWRYIIYVCREDMKIYVYAPNSPWQGRPPASTRHPYRPTKEDYRDGIWIFGWGNSTCVQCMDVWTIGRISMYGRWGEDMDIWTIGEYMDIWTIGRIYPYMDDRENIWMYGRW